MRLCPPLLGTIATAMPSLALASDHVEVVVHEAVEPDDAARLPGTSAPPNGTTVTRTVHVVERAPDVPETTWIGLSAGLVTAPLSRRGAIDSSDRIGADPLHACLDAEDRRWCSSARGVDLRLQIFATRDRRHYPRLVGYLRSGYETGQARLLPARATGPQRGEAIGVSYRAVPVFAGVSVYAFERFPVRPFVGLGVGVDALLLRWDRHQRGALVDGSGRFGFELHGGVEARIGNWVAFTAELQQKWSVRRELPGAPDFVGTRLAVITGVTVAVPYATYSRRDPRADRVSTTTRTTHQGMVVPVTRVRVGPPTEAPVFPEHVREPAPPRTVIVPPPETIVAPPVATPPVATPPVER